VAPCHAFRTLYGTKDPFKQNINPLKTFLGLLLGFVLGFICWDWFVYYRRWLVRGGSAGGLGGAERSFPAKPVGETVPENRWVKHLGRVRKGVLGAEKEWNFLWVLRDWLRDNMNSFFNNYMEHV